MKKLLLFCLLTPAIHQLLAQTVPPAEQQIKLAVLAAPAGKGDGATIYGYTPQKEVVVLRKGTNEMVCLADDPSTPGFSVACYHQDLDSFMIRGRALRKEGKKSAEIFDMREKEVKTGTLKMPKQSATLYVYSAPKENYDTTNWIVKDGYLRAVVYIPYATEKSTGLPVSSEVPGMPWIMHPGTHGAHIMINPPKGK